MAVPYKFLLLIVKNDKEKRFLMEVYTYAAVQLYQVFAHSAMENEAGNIRSQLLWELLGKVLQFFR